MTKRTITAMFDSRAEAEPAVEGFVREIGIARTAVRLDAGTGTGASQEEKGFLASLRDLFVPDEDRQTYAEGLRRGGVVVSAQVEEAQVDRAMDVLERSGAVDLDEREAEWRRSGWTGTAAAAGAGAVVGASSDGTRTGTAAMPATGRSTPDGTPGNPSGTMLSRGVDQVAGSNISGAHPENDTINGKARPSTVATGTATTAAPLQGEEVIPIVEERLVVGKREVARGRIRVRSFVVETPVQEQVTLHEEHVDVQRRPVDRAVTDADGLFQDRTIEASETSEEAVIGKDVRVKEELVVRKDATDRVQTVQDTVRRTEVEVDDQRTAGTTPKAVPVQPAPAPRNRT